MNMLTCYALSISVTAAMLAGCGGSQPPMAAPNLAVLNRPSTNSDAQGRDLLYTSTAFAGGTNVYTYPGEALVGSLSINGSIGNLCSNRAGDVFIPTTYAINEYQHGRSTPIAVLGNEASGCSVDPTTGNLATNFENVIAIYRPELKHRWHLPHSFTLKADTTYSCAYDGAGNLFVDGLTRNGLKPFFAELPKGASGFEKLILNQRISTPGTMQWDGKYLAIGDQGNTIIRRFAITGSSGSQVGTLTLDGASELFDFWIQGNVVIASVYDSPAFYVGFWQYPAGGSAQSRISGDTHIQGVTVSVVRR
jgi:hypothetical protein